MKSRTFLLIAIFAAFTVYSTLVVLDHGYTGFLALPMAGGWGTQVFIDLCIALTLFIVWMVPDARDRELPAIPYVLAILTLGSVGALAYLVHRSLKEDKGMTRQPAKRATAS